MSAQRKRKRRQLRIFPVMALFCIIAAIFFYGKPLVSHFINAGLSLPVFSRQQAAPEHPPLPEDMPRCLVDLDFLLDKSIDLTYLHSPNAVLIDYDKHIILSKNNSNQQIYPASLTKMMTAIVAIEKTEDMTATITLSENMFTPLYQNHASVAGFSPKEEVRKDDLLYGMLLPSGAECCLAFATEIAGNEENFVKLMNEKAQEIGMKNTHFTNTIGLQDSNHYSTVQDMGILLTYALKNETFRQIFTTESYTTHSTAIHPKGVELHSTMFIYLDGRNLSNGKIIGGKTGYTTEAGQCLASLATINGKEYILVTAGAARDKQTTPLQVEDALTVYSQITTRSNITLPNQSL